MLSVDKVSTHMIRNYNVNTRKVMSKTAHNKKKKLEKQNNF